MINRKKRKRLVKGFYILLILFIFLIGIKWTWHTHFSVEEMFTPSLAQRVETSKFSPPQSLENQKYRIVIDPGHGGKDPGATGASGAYEKAFNLSLGIQVYKLLQDEPMFDPRLTRTEDQFVALEDRTAVANDWNADALLSIHGNTYTDETITGTETLYRHDDSIPLAQTVQQQIVKDLGSSDRGVKYEQLKVLSASTMPAVLVEVGYLTNADEEAYLLSSKGQDLAAHAIVNGLKQYFSQGIPHKQPIEEEKEEVQPPVSVRPGNQVVEKKVFYNGSAKDGKQVALTFDDGPDTIVTPKILDILTDNHIKATFFLLGNRAKAHPELVRRIVEEGHALGNHSWSHPNFDKIPMNEVMKQINDTQDELEATVGFRPILFRPPYGALSKAEEEVIHNMNLEIIDWSVDTMDWSGLPSQDIMKLIHKELKPGGIILQHTANGKNHLANTIEALKLLIPDLRGQGYTFVTIPKLLHLPDSQPNA